MSTLRPLQKIRSPWIMVPAVAVLVIALGAYWFFHHFEKKAFEEYQGGSPAALKNPLLAAQRYLAGMGKETIASSGISNLTSLPPPNGALFIYRLPRGLNKTINDNLFAWVQSGGHLLLTPGFWKRTSATDDILTRLGVRIQKGSNDCGCPPKTTHPAAKTSGQKSAKKVAARILKKKKATDGYHPYNSIIDLDLDGFPVHLQYSGAALLSDTNNSAAFRINGSYRISYIQKADKAREDNNTIKDRPGNWLLQYKVGAGKITVLSENTLFTNHEIGSYDHAFLLAWLLRDDKTVQLLYSSRAEGLPAIIWKQMPYFWVSLSVFLLLILWRMQKRSGSLLTPDTDEHHNILSHIGASGMFSWRMNKARTIIAANRKALVARWAGRSLGVKQGQETNHLSTATLAAKTGFSEKDIFNAFRLRVESEQDLIKTSRALQKIHRRLQSGESIRNDG